MVRAAPRVLVLDDDLPICEVVKLALSDDGWDVEARTCGQEALECLQQSAVDIILLDLNLRDMDAEDFLARCRQQGVEDTPIVLLSAATGLDDHADRLSVQGWLSKPFDIDELCDTVRRFVVQDRADGSQSRISDGC